MPEEKYLVLFWILGPFIKPLLSLFVDITSTFFDSSFNSFSTSTYFVLFEVTFLLNFFSLSSKFTTSLLRPKFACANLAATLSAVTLVNSEVVIYVLWTGSGQNSKSSNSS